MIQIDNQIENTSLVQVSKMLIERLTHPEEEILDPFAGKGSCLVAASLCKRYAVGIELYPKYYEEYQKLVIQENIASTEAYFIADCLERLSWFNEENFSLVITEPPVYGTYPENSNPCDFSTALSEAMYFHLMQRAFEECYRVLKPKKYIALIIRNGFQKDSFIREAAHFSFEGEILWKCSGLSPASILLLKKGEQHG